MADLIVGALALAAVIAGGLWPKLTARSRYRANYAAIHATDVEDRIAAVARICDQGLDRNSRLLLEVIESEKDPVVLDAIVDGICLRQWEPGRSESIRELRDFARARLSDEGKLSRFLPPALNRAADLGGPRRDEWRGRQFDKPDPSYVAKSLEQLWDDLGRLPLKVVGPDVDLSIDFGGDAEVGALKRIELDGRVLVAGKRFDANYEINMQKLPERGIQAKDPLILSTKTGRPVPEDQPDPFRRRRASSSVDFSRTRPVSSSPFSRNHRRHVVPIQPGGMQK